MTFLSSGAACTLQILRTDVQVPHQSCKGTPCTLDGETLSMPPCPLHLRPARPPSIQELIPTSARSSRPPHLKGAQEGQANLCEHLHAGELQNSPHAEGSPSSYTRVLRSHPPHIHQGPQHSRSPDADLAPLLHRVPHHHSGHAQP